MRVLILAFVLALKLGATDTAFLVPSSIGSSGTHADFHTSANWTRSYRLLGLTLSGFTGTATAGTYTNGTTTNGTTGNAIAALFTYTVSATCVFSAVTVTYQGFGYTSGGPTAVSTPSAAGCTGGTVTPTMTASLSTFPGDGDAVVGNYNSTGTNISYYDVYGYIGSQAGTGVKQLSLGLVKLYVEKAGVPERLTVNFGSTGSDPSGGGPQWYLPGATATEFGWIMGTADTDGSATTTIDSSVGLPPQLYPSSRAQAQWFNANKGTNYTIYVSDISNDGTYTLFQCFSVTTGTSTTCPTDAGTSPTTGLGALNQGLVFAHDPALTQPLTLAINDVVDATSFHIKHVFSTFNGFVGVPTVAVTTPDGVSPTYMYLGFPNGTYSVSPTLYNLYGWAINCLADSTGNGNFDGIYLFGLSTSAAHPNQFKMHNSIICKAKDTVFNFGASSGSQYINLEIGNVSVWHAPTSPILMGTNYSSTMTRPRIYGFVEADPGSAHSLSDQNVVPQGFDYAVPNGVFGFGVALFSNNVNYNLTISADNPTNNATTWKDVMCSEQLGTNPGSNSGCIALASPFTSQNEFLDGMISDGNRLVYLIDPGTVATGGTFTATNVWNRMMSDTSTSDQGESIQQFGSFGYYSNIVQEITNSTTGSQLINYVIHDSSPNTTTYGANLDNIVLDGYGNKVEEAITKASEDLDNAVIAYRSLLYANVTPNDGISWGTSDCGVVGACQVTYLADTVNGNSIGIHNNLMNLGSMPPWERGNGNTAASPGIGNGSPGINYTDGTHLNGCGLTATVTTGGSGYTASSTYSLTLSTGSGTVAPIVAGVTNSSGVFTSAYMMTCGYQVTPPLTYSTGVGGAVITVTGSSSRQKFDYLYADHTDVPPQFLDANRTPALYAQRFWGCDGTQACLQELMATNWANPSTFAGATGCPICSPIYDGAYGATGDNFLRAMLKWLMLGHVSNNPVTWQAGWNGHAVASLPGTCTPHAANDTVWLNGKGPYGCFTTNTWTPIQQRDIGVTGLVAPVQRFSTLTVF